MMRKEPICISDILRHIKIERLDAELIIAHIIEKNREFILTHPEYILDKKQSASISNLIERRTKKEPLAHLLGHKEFFGLDFTITKDTLIPRPETELMVEEILQLIGRDKFRGSNASPDHSKTVIADIGTGSGNIIISIAKQIEKSYSEKNFSFYGIDISSQALRVAKNNAKRHTIEKKIRFIHSDLLENFSPDDGDDSIDSLIIAANLPYLSHTIYQSSMTDVKKYEPKTTLFSKEKGLWHYKKLLRQIAALKKRHPYLAVSIFFEISPEQHMPIEGLIRKYFPSSSPKTLKDLSKKWRLTVAAIA